MIEDLGQHRIAIVEDDPDIVEGLSFWLQDMGYTVVPCPPTSYVHTTIAEAQPRLVILDVRMAQVDGIAVFRELRANPATSAIPVIFFTATEQRVQNQIPDFEQQGAYFVIKPNIAQLSRRIREILDAAQ